MPSPLEVGRVRCFSSIKKAISYCGLCGAESSSGESIQRTPLSKQRNRHLQTILIEGGEDGATEYLTGILAWLLIMVFSLVCPAYEPQGGFRQMLEFGMS